MKKIILTFLLCAVTFGSFAQLGKEKTEVLPEKGDFLVSLLLGRGQYANSVSAPSTNTGTVFIQTPSLGVVNGGNNSLVNMIGIEGRYFISDQLAVRLSGGVIINSTPARDQIEDNGDATLPYIDAVEAVQNTNLHFIPGVEYHYELDSKRLSPYTGFAVPFYYSKNSQYDPQFDLGSGDAVDLYGTRHAIALGVGAQAYAGMDYHINKDIYFGVQINAVGYDYVLTQYSSGEGFDLGQANTHSFNFLTQPVLKFGFKF